MIFMFLFNSTNQSQPAKAPPIWAISPPALFDVIPKTLMSTVITANHLSLTLPTNSNLIGIFGISRAVATIIAIIDAEAPDKSEIFPSKNGI